MWNCVPSWITAAPSKRAESHSPGAPRVSTGLAGSMVHSTPSGDVAWPMSVGLPFWSDPVNHRW